MVSSPAHHHCVVSHLWQHVVSNPTTVRWFSGFLFAASPTCIQNVKRIKASMANKTQYSWEAVGCYLFVDPKKG